MVNPAEPTIIDGCIHVDTRGTVVFANKFDFQGVDRSYIVRPHSPDHARGWVGHKRERKWFWVIQGAVVVSLVKPDDWHFPSRDLTVRRYVLSDAKPQVLFVPPGYATASMSLCPNAIFMVFSSGIIEESKSDDFRFSLDTWPIVAN